MALDNAERNGDWVGFAQPVMPAPWTSRPEEQCPTIRPVKGCWASQIWNAAAMRLMPSLPMATCCVSDDGGTAPHQEDFDQL